MATHKLQFDVLLGGTQTIPPEISVKRFAAARAHEIAALTQAIEDPQRTGLIFQKLPRHMRRRVMSRTSKRLPRRLRDAHMHQLTKSGLPPKPKRPSRRYRRRPKNLLLEYNRRQKKNVWLETHIWHAKRFHMIEKWGYSLADFPNDKSFRACYRATANHCLLQDISYNNCIELNGPVSELLDQLQKLTSKECGLTFGAKAFLNGTREGSVVLFHPNSFPYGAIGRVNFLWRSMDETPCADIMQTNGNRTIWIWVHPAFYHEVLNELMSLFDFNAVESVENPSLSKVIFPTELLEVQPSSDNDAVEKSDSPVKKKQKLEVKEKVKNVEEIKLENRNVPFIRTPKYRSKIGCTEMILLKDTLNRFRLTGPLSHAVLLQSLNIANIKEITCKVNHEIGDMMELDASSNNEVDELKWWNSYYSETMQHGKSWCCQETLWNTLKGAASPAQLPSHFVLPLTIQDPRLQLPSKRVKALPDKKDLWNQESEEQLISVSPSACVSPIWRPDIRDSSTSSKMSMAELAELRSHNLVPGVISEEFDYGFGSSSNSVIQNSSQVKSCIPVLLIQRPGSQDSEIKRLGFASGWDVIMPAGWAMPLWQALVFRGARAGGLRETNSVGFEAGSEPVFAPDTLAGSTENEAQKVKLVEHHFRLPPKKRPNFVKLGISSPFICSWNVLANDWSKPSVGNLNVGTSSYDRIFVLRERKKLEVLKIVVNDFKRRNVKNGCLSKLTTNLVDLFPNAAPNCLVPVTVHMYGKGCPSSRSIICIPSEDDIDNISQNPHFPGPTEVLHEDEHQGERKTLRAEHKKLLKQLRRKRVREKQKQEENGTHKSDSDQSKSKHIPVISKRKGSDFPPTKEISDKQEEIMRSLWLPKTEKVMESCTRTVIGFVSIGSFSFTESKGIGQGYVVLPALLQLISCYERRLRERKKLTAPWVLLRNPSSQQYRFGLLDIQSDV